MLYTKERLKEMLSSVDQNILWYILEEQEKQTAILEQSLGNKSVAEEQKEERQKRTYTRKEDKQ